MQTNASSSDGCNYYRQQHDARWFLTPALCYSCASEERLVISPLPSMIQILSLEHILEDRLKKLQIKQFPNSCVAGFLVL